MRKVIRLDDLRKRLKESRELALSMEKHWANCENPRIAPERIAELEESAREEAHWLWKFEYELGRYARDASLKVEDLVF